MIEEAWDRFLSYTLSMLMGGALLILLVLAGGAFGFWLGRRGRDFHVELAVKRDRVAKAWEDTAARTQPIFVAEQRGEGE